MIKGENVLLRQLEPADVHLLYNWENNLENWRVSNTYVAFSKDMLEQYVKSPQDIFTHQQVRFIICESNRNPIGTIDLFDYDPINLRAGIGILIADKKVRGKGYGKEALELLINYAKYYLNLNQLYCNIEESNEVSLSLFSKLEFEQTGVKKQWLNQGGKWMNVLFYQKILNE